jgi:glyoxylase-like metal-dependent hydrolase (beta-lactamase superfamily II)
MIFRQLFDPETSTFTYLVGCPRTRRAVLVDPVIERVDDYVALLAELDLRLHYTLETHVHADHVTGADALRTRLGSRSVVHRDAGARCADLLVTGGVLLQVGDLDIEVLATPGHTAGDVSYRIGDRVLTGDALFIGGTGRTDFQEGDAGRLYDSITGVLFALPPDTLVFPGHDYRGNTVSTIRQEMASNPRVGGGKSRTEFIDIMSRLQLPRPRQIDRAVPANQACGRE